MLNSFTYELTLSGQALATQDTSSPFSRNSILFYASLFFPDSCFLNCHVLMANAQLY